MLLRIVRHEETEKYKSQLPSQDFVITFLLDHFLTTFNSLWSSLQKDLPKNIFIFTFQHFNNTLADRTNLNEWTPSLSPSCSLCLQPESLLHIVASCTSYLEDG